MSRLSSLFLALLLFSCANSTKEPVHNIKTVMEEDAVEHMMESGNLTLDKLISDKLMAYFELVKLERKYPEFKADIVLQLKDISKEELTEPDHQDDFSIENIRMASDIRVISDSIQQARLYYDIVSENLRETDSIKALIVTKTIVLDGKKTKSAKITFSKID